MKKLFLGMVMMLLFAALISTPPPMTDAEMQAIIEQSDNWDDFEDELDEYVESHDLQNLPFHEQVTEFLQDDVGPQSEAEVKTWWADEGWYPENQIEWIWPWSLWYLKYREKWNGAQWV